MTSSVCEFAAQNGHIDCLKYAHQQGTSLTSKVCEFAAQNGHIDCLQYAHANNCPYPEILLPTIVKKILIPKWRVCVKVLMIGKFWYNEIYSVLHFSKYGPGSIEDRKSYESDMWN